MRERTKEMKRTLAIVVLLLGLGVCVMLYCEWRGTLKDTLDVCGTTFLTLPIFAVLIGMAHHAAGRGMSGKEYVRQLFCGRAVPGNRKAYLDYVRVFAAVMVILTHACSMQVGEDVAAWRTNLLLVCEGIGLVCNPLYVMISGALLLSAEKEEEFGAFYFRRFVKVVVPLVVYYVIFLCISGQMSLIPPKNIGKGALQILAGASGIVPHYWLIYTLISLYVVAPFVRVMVRNLNDKGITVLFFLIMLEEVLVTYLPLAGVETGFIMNLAGWEGIFILGYILTTRRAKWMEYFVLICGTVSAIIIPIAFIFDYSLKNYVCNTAPVMVLFAGAVLIGASKLESVLKNKFSYFVMALSKYSYSIILVHWYGLFVVTWGKIGVQPLRFGCVGGIALTVLTGVIVCFVMGFLADNTIVLVVQYIVNAIGNTISVISSKKQEKR